MLASLEGAGGIAAAIVDVRALAQARAHAIAGRGLALLAALPAAQRPAVAEAVKRFTGDAICRMVVVCGILRGAGLGA